MMYKRDFIFSSLFVCFFFVSFLHADKKMMELLQAGNYQNVMQYFNSLDTAKDAHAQAIVSHAIKTGTFKDLQWSYSDWYYKTNGCALLHQLSQDKQLTFLKKTDELKDFFKISYYDQYFSTYLDKVFENDIFQNLYCHETMTDVMKQLADFTVTEFNKGNVVICHGQADFWAFLQHIYREILSIKIQNHLPDDFIALRFNEKTNLDAAHVQKIRKNGVTYKTSNDLVSDRFNVLFATLIPFQNNTGENSYYYSIKNFDQSKQQGRYTGTIATIFEDAGMKEEYDWLIKNNPVVFDELEALYKAANAEQGNCGNLIAFSLSISLADQLVYPTRTGAFLNPVCINGKQETRLSEIIKNFDQVGAFLEIALILAPEILDPFKAQKAGVTMKYFGPMITNNTKKYQEFKNKLTEIMKLVKSHYDNRNR